MADTFHEKETWGSDKKKQNIFLQNLIFFKFKINKEGM